MFTLSVHEDLGLLHIQAQRQNAIPFPSKSLALALNHVLLIIVRGHNGFYFNAAQVDHRMLQFTVATANYRYSHLMVGANLVSWSRISKWD